MPANKSKSLDYKSLSASTKNGGANSGDQLSLKSNGKLNKQENGLSPKSLINSAKKLKNQFTSEAVSKKEETKQAENFVFEKTNAQKAQTILPEAINYAEEQKQKKREKKAEKDYELLNSDRWLVRNGHNLTYCGLYVFSILVLFRPYELIPTLSFLATTPFYFAVATLLVYIPTQFSTEGSLTILSTEIKCVLAMTLLALVTMPIGKDVAGTWTTFNDTFIKSVLIFIVMVNVVRTRRRLRNLMWLSLGVGIYLSYSAIDLYLNGEMKLEGYRVDVEVKGLFGNPNELALHLVTMTPIAIVLGFTSRNRAAKYFYFVMAALFVTANMITFSRGGFLGLFVALAILAWKIGRGQRLNIIIASVIGSILFILAAPGNYGLRLLSIFIPGLDPVGSSDQRKELLFRSIFVTLRNPWGIGMGNSPVMNDYNLQWHNAYTQVASELTLLGLASYLIFLISPFRKLGAIERTLFAKGELDWFYYMAIGLQASIVGYMVSSFFASVAYNWFIYYLIAYAVAVRRIYAIEKNVKEETGNQTFSKLGKNLFGWQSA